MAIIKPENHLALWTIIIFFSILSFVIEHKCKWASVISAPVIALIFAMILSNFGIIPTVAPTYDIVWNYIVPLSIPLLLMKCDIKRIWKESGRLLIIFLIGSFGTTAGTLTAYFLLKNYINEIEGVAAMITGTYIGGTVNLMALADAFNVSEKTISAVTVADNFLMALYFFVLISISSIKIFRRIYKHPYIDKIEKNKKADKINFEYKTKEIYKKNILTKDFLIINITINIAVSFIIVLISKYISNIFSNFIPISNILLKTFNGLLGNQYLIITTISIICASVFKNIFNKINLSQEIGTFFIYLFFFVIGCPASLNEIIKNSPILFVFCLIAIFINMVFTLVFGKILNFNLEEIILSSNANIGGPTTATAMAISKGWAELVGPIMLVGVFGYAIGTYFGVLIGNLLI